MTRFTEREAGRGIAAVRLAAAFLLALYVLSYEPIPGHPSPGYVIPVGITLALLLGATSIAQLTTRMRRSQDPQLLGLGIDTAVVLALTWLYVFDPSDHVYLLLIPVQAEATLLLGPRWGFGSWAFTTCGFVAIEALDQTSHNPGILLFSAAGLLVVAATGALSRDLTAQNRLFRALLEPSPEAILIVDESGAIETANAQAVRLFGFEREELIGIQVEMLVPKRLGEAHIRHRADWSRAPVARPLNSGHELFGLRKDGSEFRADIMLSPASSGGRFHTLVMVRDVTERHRMEEALRTREEELRLVLDQLPGMLWTTDRELRFTSSKGKGLAALGLTSDQVVGLSGYEFLGSGDKAHPAIAAHLRALDGESVTYGDDYDGRGYDVYVEPLRDREGTIVGVVGVSFDITDRKRAEGELREALEVLQRTDEQRRRLLHRLVGVQERERAEIARDLHDDSIQVVTAVGMRLATLRHRLEDPEDVDALVKLEDVVASAVGRLRRTLFELYPRVLDEDGLSSTLRVYLEQVEKDDGIVVHLEDHLPVEPSKEARVILYRIALEALANVRKHSRAANVTVRLDHLDEGVLVRIEDNGIGFDASADPALPGHLGIASMRERAELAGGWCRHESSSGSGTRVDFWIPDAASLEPAALAIDPL